MQQNENQKFLLKIKLTYFVRVIVLLGLKLIYLQFNNIN